MSIPSLSTSTSMAKNNPLRSSQSDNKKIDGDAQAHLKNSNDSLSITYSMNLCHPAPGVHAPKFFAVREQVIAIESYLENKKPVDLVSIRQRVGLLLQCTDYEKKMAELGLLLFYLDRDGALPKSDSLLEYRSQEMKKNVENYTSAHSKAKVDQKIPSGKTHYLLRAFAHMLVTKGASNQDHILNCGGLIAIKQLLLQPSLEISKFFQPEHREHILIVADQIRKHSGVMNLFKQKVTVHPDLQEIIRLDLKYKPDAPIHSVDVFYACIMVLFSDIRQHDFPNCFAVGAFIYITENHTYKVLSQMIQWLSDGYFVFSATTQLPIAPLVENRLFDRKELCVEIESSEALKLAPFATIARMLSLNVPQGLTGVCSIENLLNQLLPSNPAPHLKNQAEKYYHTYKCLALTKLVFAILETLNLNRGKVSLTTSFSKHKEELIKACMDGVIPATETNNPYTPFLMRLKTKLEAWLWLENCSETKVEIVGNSVLTRSHTIMHFSGNVTHLTEVLENYRKVFCWIQGKYTALHTISALQNTVMSAIAEVKKELIYAGEFQDPLLEKKYRSAARSLNFRSSISKYASSQIDKKGIAPHHLQLCDLMIFKRRGGSFAWTLEATFGVQLKRHVIEKCKTPYRLLEMLMQTLKNAIHNTTVPRFGLGTQAHAWTLSTHCWKILFDNQDNFNQFIQKNVFNRAKARFNKPVSSDLIERVINCYTQREEVREGMRVAFAKRDKWTYRKFKAKLLEGMEDEEDRSFMKKAIESEFSTIEIKKADLELILSKLGVLPDNAHQVDDMMLKIGSGAARPYHFASKLRDLLMDEKMAILDLWDIEQAVCKIMNYPVIINIGDCNWIDSFREDPAHVHLVMDFSWYYETPAFFTRKPLEQTMITDLTDYDWFSILYPQ